MFCPNPLKSEKASSAQLNIPIQGSCGQGSCIQERLNTLSLISSQSLNLPQPQRGLNSDVQSFRHPEAFNLYAMP